MSKDTLANIATTLALIVVLILWAIASDMDYQDERELDCAVKGQVYSAKADMCTI